MASLIKNFSIILILLCSICSLLFLLTIDSSTYKRIIVAIYPQYYNENNNNKIKAPPKTPYLLRNHRILNSNNNYNINNPKTSSWWYRVDYDEDNSGSDFISPANRRSLDSVVYRVYKDDSISNNNKDDENKNTRRTRQIQQEQQEEQPGNPIPVPSNIDSNNGNNNYHHHSSNKKDIDINKIQNEYMIVTGGFTDTDWSTFPVWAFDLNITSLSSGEQQEEQDQQWIDLSGLNIGSKETSTKENNKNSIGYHLFGSNSYNTEKEQEEDQQQQEEQDKEALKNRLWPSGRVGHVSGIYNDSLYVFGGLLWKDQNFYVEDVPYVWKTKNNMLSRKLAAADATTTTKAAADNTTTDNTTTNADNVLEWVRIIPRVIPYKDETKKNETGVDHDSNSYNNNNNIVPSTDKTLTRGECRGGHWEYGQSLVFYGGLHVQHHLNSANNAQTQQNSQGNSNNNYRQHQNNNNNPQDIPLGDVWIYNYTTSTLEQLVPYPPPNHMRDAYNNYPVARTAHSATIIGNKLYIYGGMTTFKANNNGNHHYRSDENSYYTNNDDPSAIPIWDELDDLWIFDLLNKKWEQRIVEPSLSRSYHSMVGWDDGSIAIFGGFRTAHTISGEPIAFVFSDTLISHPSDSNWWKAEYTNPETTSSTSNSKYGSSSYPNNEADSSSEDYGADNRLEHTASVDRYGIMYIYGGRFKTVLQIDGMWSLNLFGSTSKVSFVLAPPDGLEAYEAELEALHMLVAMMLLMSVLFTALYGTLRRQALIMNHGGGGAGLGDNGEGGVDGGEGVGHAVLGRRSRNNVGLSREAIDSLPTKSYIGKQEEQEDDTTTTTETTLSSPADDNNNKPEPLTNDDEKTAAKGGRDSDDDDDDDDLKNNDMAECCPICLVEYETGDELRCLPCNHEFHSSCVDSWLENNTSCPACRHLLDNASIINNNNNNNNNDTDSDDDDDDDGNNNSSRRRNRSSSSNRGDGLWRVEMRLEPITVLPEFSLTQILANRQIGSWFGGPHSTTTTTTSGNDTNDNDSSSAVEEHLHHHRRHRRRRDDRRRFRARGNRNYHINSNQRRRVVSPVVGDFGDHQSNAGIESGDGLNEHDDYDDDQGTTTRRSRFGFTRYFSLGTGGGIGVSPTSNNNRGIERNNDDDDNGIELSSTETTLQVV